jgi:hypothetical protein
VWFGFWFVAAYMLVLNLFLAIIVDNYAAVRRGVGRGLGIIGQARQVLWELEWMFSYEGSRRRHPTSQALLDSLVACQSELKAFLHRPNAVTAIRSDPAFRRRWALMDTMEPVSAAQLHDEGLDEASAVRLMGLTQDEMEHCECYGEDLLNRFSVSVECELRRVRNQFLAANAELDHWKHDAVEKLLEVSGIQRQCTTWAQCVVQRAEVPPGWSVEVDENSGVEYFVNLNTGLTSWSLPRR